MANDSMHVTPSQPSLKGGQLPHGHIILNSKFHGTPLIKSISELSFSVVFDESIGLIDCYPSSNCAVIIVLETHLIMETELKQKMRKLAKFPHCKVMIAEVSDISQQYFRQLQDQIIFNDADIRLIPVGNHRETALLITNLSQVDNQSNPFIQKQKNRAPLEESILDVVHSFPGVGGKKALDLLTSFQSIKNILTTNSNDLTKVVGKATAESVAKMASQEK